MNIQNFVIGIFVFLLCVFLALSLPLVTQIPAQPRELLQMALLALGILSPIMGLLSK